MSDLSNLLEVICVKPLKGTPTSTIIGKKYYLLEHNYSKTYLIYEEKNIWDNEIPLNWIMRADFDKFFTDIREVRNEKIEKILN